MQLGLPNYTQVPNAIIDVMMKELSGSELKILLAICRKTIGWHKVSDSISFSQLKKLTGGGNDQCVEGLKRLELIGLISIQRIPGQANKIDLCLPTTPETGEVPLPFQERTTPETGDTKETLQKKVKETLSPASAERKGKNAEVKEITDYYQRLFLEEYEAKPTWDGRIMKLVRADLARLGAETLGGLIQLFFEYPGQFVTKNETGMGYNIFHSQIDALLERRRRVG